jgi:hypothetical protein
MVGGCGQSVVEEKFEEMQAAKESPEIPEVDEDGKPLTKKARTALLRAAEKEREKRHSAASDKIDPEVTPLSQYGFWLIFAEICREIHLGVKGHLT